MDTLGYFLGDKTRNDNTLVYELLNLVNHYLVNNKKIDYYFVDKVVDIYLGLEENIVNEIQFKSFTKSSLGIGLCNNGTLTFDLNKLKNWVRKDKKSLNIDNLVFDNEQVLYLYEILSTVFHELTHAKQEYLIDNFENKYYLYELEETFNQKEYDKLYDYLPTERYANIRGSILSVDILSRLNLSNNDVACLRYLELCEYLYNYEVSFPLSEYSRELYYLKKEKLLVPILSELDFIDKTHVGLFINNDDYDRLNNLLSLIIDKDINPKDNIKELIKRI